MEVLGFCSIFDLKLMYDVVFFLVKWFLVMLRIIEDRYVGCFDNFVIGVWVVIKGVVDCIELIVWDGVVVGKFDCVFVL